MDFGTWNTLFNLLALLFWFRVWNRPDRQMVFNPFLVLIDRIGDKVTGFLKPVFIGVPDRMIALLVIAAIIVFRALLAPTKGAWFLTLGITRQIDAASVAQTLTFSVLSFAVFLFRFWGITLLFAHPAFSAAQRTSAALHSLSRPFSDWRLHWRPIILLCYGTALVLLLDNAGQAPGLATPAAGTDFTMTSAHDTVGVIEAILLSLIGWVQNLPLLMEAMFVLIIGSWIGMFAAPGLVVLCREWMELLLGPLRRYPVRLGMLDLSPLIFFVAIWLSHAVLMTILVSTLRAFG